MNDLDLRTERCVSAKEFVVSLAELVTEYEHQVWMNNGFNFNRATYLAGLFQDKVLEALLRERGKR